MPYLMSKRNPFANHSLLSVTGSLEYMSFCFANMHIMTACHNSFHIGIINILTIFLL